LTPKYVDVDESKRPETEGQLEGKLSVVSNRRGHEAFVPLRI